MKRKISLSLTLLFFSITVLLAQKSADDSISKRCFVSTSAFMLYNFVDDPQPPSFYQLNLGYRITSKDILIVEAMTWKYYAPIGIPYGLSYGDTSQNFPGYARNFGVGLAYQRFLWKGLYSTLHITPFVQQYFSPDKVKIQTGFQLFTTLRLGYHLNLFKDRFFIEPSVACTYWPINTNMPESFAVQEDKWPNYFLFEPGFHVGFNF